MAIKLHSPMARVLYEKIQHIQEHSKSNHENWYNIREKFLSQALMELFVQFEQDEETSAFLQSCFDKSDWFFTQLYHTVSKSILSWFMTVTSANGLLNRGSMFVFSSSQFRRLLRVDDNWRAGSLLDLGAGDGKVTAKMAPLFENVYVTEISPIMRWRLSQANFTLLDVEAWDKSATAAEPHSDVSELPLVNTHGLPRPKYDVISCLNLLDRCSTPLTLLRRIHRVLRPGTGRLVLALVFPMKQFVEASAHNKPDEIMDISGSRIWEVQFSSFVQKVLTPAGYELLSWSRVPYICEGDFARSFYSLNDVVMSLRPVISFADS